MDKFGRTYTLYVDESDTSILPGGSFIPASGGLRTQLELPFTMEFDVTRNVLSSANNCTLRIYNLGETTRAKLFKDPYDTRSYKGIELQAGYQGNNPTLFKGNVKQCWSVRESNNFVTTIEAFDGGFAVINGYTSVAFPAGTPQNEILDSVINGLPGVKKGTVSPSTKVLSRGNTYSGNSAELLKELSNDGFFIDLEKANILGDNECVISTIPLIDSSTGLLGTPRREQATIYFDMLFEPRMLIGQIIELNSSTQKNFNGQYKVISVKHKGIISETMNGSAITTVGLWKGTAPLTTVVPL